MSKVAILGYGVEGKAAANYWAAGGHRVTVCDANPELHVPTEYQAQLGDEYLQHLSTFDVIVRTPSIRPDSITAANQDDPAILGRVTSGVREFFAHCPASIIGVTGTKGKGTTTTLIAKMLEAAGHTVWIGGNIGRSPLEFLAKVNPDHFVVLELSSFQLMDLERGPHIAVCLMMAPEHLNWHTDFDEYVQAKQQLFAHQTMADMAVYKGGDEASQRVAGVSP